MKMLSELVAKLGLVPQNARNEFRRWGAPIPIEEPTEAVKDLTLEEVVHLLEQARDSQEHITVKETDPNLLAIYLKCQQQKATKGVVTFPDEGGKKHTLTVSYGVGVGGEIIIPCDSDYFEDLLNDPDTYLKTDDGKIYFEAIRPMYFDSQKAFLVCRPKEEA